MDPSLLQSGLLAEALPVLLHKLANQTQLITGFHAILKMDGGEELVEARSPDLTAAGQHVEQVGWLLAALSSGAGHDLMLARREPRGLVWVVDLVQEVLHKSGVEAAGFGQPLPLLTAKSPEGWRLPWVIACMLFETYQGSAFQQIPWSMDRLDSGEWALGLPVGPEMAGRLENLAQHLPGASWTRPRVAWGCLTLPADWAQATGQ
ncbi:MAG: hypothetical protein P1V35_10410 [Planctomycetota bacterium]|nr:hypothetical protein [Planctomycetota bacterium]